MVDGVYTPSGPNEPLAFHPLPPPSEEDLVEVLEQVQRRISKLLAKNGCLSALSAEEASQAASESLEEPETLDLFKAASIRQWVALSDQPRRVEVLGQRVEERGAWEKKPFSAEAEGYSLHAGVRISSTDREGLGLLCRYILRPPFAPAPPEQRLRRREGAEERLKRLADGRILYEFRHPRFDGATHVVLEPVELLEKLAALVPPPRFHLLHYQGILAPHARRRAEVVPARIEIDETGEGCSRDHPWSGRKRRDRDSADDPPRHRRRRRRSRTDWATLLKRTLDIDILACPKCAGRMVVLACITEPDVIRKILRAMDLREEPLGAAPARSPPGLVFESDHDR